MKPFFYKLNAADFLEKVLSTPEEDRAQFVLKFALDLVCAKSDEKFTKKIIEEALDFKKKRQISGKAGGESKAKRAKDNKNQQLKPSSKAIADLELTSSPPLANSSSSSSSSSNNNKILKSKSKEVGAFAPPLPEQVAEYCISRGNSVDPDRWYNFYSAKGWMIGKNKMKDWKAAVRTWEKEDKPKPSYGSQGIAVLDEMRRRTNGGMDNQRDNGWADEDVHPEIKKLPTSRHDSEDS